MRFVVASANGLAVSLSYAFFLVCCTYTYNLTSKLLPKPRPTSQGQGPLLLEAERDKEHGVVVVLEECGDEVKEGGDIAAGEMKKETKGLLEKKNQR